MVSLIGLCVKCCTCSKISYSYSHQFLIFGWKILRFQTQIIWYHTSRCTKQQTITTIPYSTFSFPASVIKFLDNNHIGIRLVETIRSKLPETGKLIFQAI